MKHALDGCIVVLGGTSGVTRIYRWKILDEGWVIEHSAYIRLVVAVEE